MSFLDRVTKAVSDTVDRGKKEVDQFVRIQKVKGEVGAAESKIGEFKTQILQLKSQIGEKAVEMLRAGTLAAPELQVMREQIDDLDRQIAAEDAVIVEKRAEIEKIKAEDEAEQPAPVEPPKP